MTPPNAYVPRVPARMYDRTKRALDAALEHLHRVVDHQDDDCDFDHHGFCQTHFISGSEPGKCGIAEARAFLAAHEGDDGGHET